VEAAVEIQHALQARNGQLPEGRRLEFRIGVNLGEIIVEDERIYATRSNVAARLESMADGGGVCVSGAVHDQIAGKLALSWEPLGEQRVKNIPRAVRVYRVRLAPGLPDQWAAAVHTPADLTGRRSQCFPFARSASMKPTGTSETASSRTSSERWPPWPDLFVISRNSTSSVPRVPGGFQGGEGGAGGAVRPLRQYPPHGGSASASWPSWPTHETQAVL